MGATLGSITLARAHAKSLTFSVTPSTLFTQVGGTGGNVAIEDEVTVKVANPSSRVATAILFKAAPFVEFQGVVNNYTAASGPTYGSITVVNRAGVARTLFTTSSTKLTQVHGVTRTVSIGDRATVEAASSARTVATRISFVVVAPSTFSGRITAYVPASGLTSGSITVAKGAATRTFVVTPTTKIALAAAVGATLAVGDRATVKFAALAHPVALTIGYSVAS